MYKKTFGKEFTVTVPCNFFFVYVIIKSGMLFLFKCDNTVLPPAGAEESEAPAGCDVTLSSEGSELPPGWCVVIHYC